MFLAFLSCYFCMCNECRQEYSSSILCAEPVPVVHETAQATSTPYPVQSFHPVPQPASYGTVVQGNLLLLLFVTTGCFVGVYFVILRILH